VKYSNGPVVGDGLLDREFWILDLVYAVGGDLRHPLFERFRFGRRDGLDEAEKLLLVSDIGFSHFAVSGRQFESVTICNGFIPLIPQAFFQDPPIECRVFTVRQNRDHIHNREVPLLGRIIPYCPDFLFLK